MKKITALLVALSLFATTAFAAPLSVAASLSTPAQTVTSGAGADLDALFTDVAAVPLTNAEAQAVEGEGIGLAIAGFAAGYVLGVAQWGVVTAVTALTGGNIGTPKEQMNNMLLSGATNAVTGFIIGAVTPGP
ncbi:MAG: hypothetical protein LBK00_05765 [Treponema sp.]|jgi:hypothetical protein|nr:hypothetical protein [Treponema sp.]